MEFIRPFEELGKGDAGIAGGKGASLGEMIKAGISVPPGFVVLAGTFDRFVEEAGLLSEIESALDSVKPDEMSTVERASEKIQAMIIGKEMPDDIAKEVLERFVKLDAEFVAVRSSATAEDSSSAAWAGQLDTFLNTTEETLLENVQKCWASLFTPRAIFYRIEKGMRAQKISVAVVVQKMVQSEVSGIAFSVHPVTEDYNQMIIEAGFGLGDAIVSGQVTPDSYVIEKDQRKIIEKNISYQSKALWRAEHGGNEWRDLSESEGTKPALSDEQALQLAEIVMHIEKHYGFPCDIEWAFEAGQFFITQSRPITTLKQESQNLNQAHLPAGAHLVLVEELVGTMPSDAELYERSKGFVLIDGKEYFLGTLDAFAREHPEYIFKRSPKVDGTVTEIKGQSASLGTATGKVRIVKNRDQARLVEMGDIIVSPMTTPDFLTAMQKAAAFVTDEGGVTCHAAIVAREMKKPCVIGTKIATQVFKDGDMVEVDADKGIVRKL